MELLSLNHLIWVLPLIIIVLLTAYWAFAQRRRAIALLTQDAKHCNLRSNAGPIRRRILASVLLTSLLLALLALLRPIGGTEISEHRRPAKNLVVLLDISNSMSAVDTEGISRIEAAKLLLREFINKRPTDRIGLVSFAGATFTESPVTLDRSILLSKVNQINPGDIPVGGTDIDSALREAQALLTEEPPPGSAIIVLSDGDNVTGQAPNEVLAKLSKAKVPILAVAVGLNGIDTSEKINHLTTRADHSTLRNLSDSTAGLFLVASPKEVDRQVNELSDRVDTIELNGENIAAEVFERPLDLYAWPLSLALLCLMIHILLPLRTKAWRPLTTVLALSLLLPKPAQAQIATTYEQALAEAKEKELPLLLLFTGSDWSKLSITFEREILSHQTFQNWANTTVIRTIIDLPRVGLSDQERNNRRALAKKFGIESYPRAVFLDSQENTLGSLTHDSKGPAAWIRRADAILSGETAASDSPASVDSLPEETRKTLESPGISETQRSIRFYNKALELEKTDPKLTLKSKDRFELLIDLYSRSASAAPLDRSDLIFAARQKLALLHHRKGQSRIPASIEELQALSLSEKKEPLIILKLSKRSLENALGIYKNILPLKPNDQDASQNLALAYQNRDRVQAYIHFIEAYQTAVKKTANALNQERRFADSLDREVTTQIEVNKQAIDDSASSIQDLITKSVAIEDQPTILPTEGLADYRLAEEDIALAPSLHRERELRTAQQHIQDALDHLIDPQQQPPPSEGEGEDGAPGENKGSGEDQGEGKGGRQNDQGKEKDGDNPQGDKPDGDEPSSRGDKEESDTENDLRRAEKEGGDLRNRLMNRMRGKNRRTGRRIPPSKNH